MPAQPTPPKRSTLTDFQKACIGMFISSGAVWQWLIKSPDLQRSLGVGYPWFMMGLTAFGLICAALSGSQIFSIMDSVKGFFSKKD